MSQGKLDERGGYFYEALLKHALKRGKNIPPFSMHKKLGELSVVSDVVFCKDDNPIAAILVTHSFSENGTHMKTWRNVDEMLYIREHFPDCGIINVIFPSEWKPNLLELMHVISDAEFSFPSILSATVVSSAFGAINAGLKNEADYTAWISDHKELKPAVEYITKYFDSLFKRGVPHNPLWYNYAASIVPARHGVIEYTQDTQIKKALVKLALLNANERNELIKNKNNVGQVNSDLLSKLRLLGIVSTGITPRISNLVRPALFDLSEDLLKSTYNLVDEKWGFAVRKMGQPINGLGSFTIYSFYDKLNASGASEEKQRMVFDHIIKWNDLHQNELNLPLYYLYTIQTCIDPRFSHRILSSKCEGLISEIWQLSMLLSGKPRDDSQVRLGEKEIKKISEVFISSFEQSGLPPIGEVYGKLVYLVEDKFIKNKYVNYLLYLCISKCLADGLSIDLSHDPHYVIGNGIADYCNSSGTYIGRNTAQTAFSFSLTYKDTLFVFSVISANAATHKHKEYPARWRCANIDHRDGTFVRSDKKQKWVVILDGIWSELFADTNEIFEKFISAGASGIFDIKTFTCGKDIKDLLDAMVD